MTQWRPSNINNYSNREGLSFAGYVVAMHSLNGDWQGVSDEEPSAENVPVGPVEALNLICLSTPSLDASKYTCAFVELH